MMIRDLKAHEHERFMGFPFLVELHYKGSLSLFLCMCFWGALNERHEVPKSGGRLAPGPDKAKQTQCLSSFATLSCDPCIGKTCNRKHYKVRNYDTIIVGFTHEP